MARATVWLKGLAIVGLAVAVAVAVAGATLWGALAIHYSRPPGEPLRLALAAAFVLAMAGAFLWLPDRRRTLLGFGAACAVLLW